MVAQRSSRRVSGSCFSLIQVFWLGTLAQAEDEPLQGVRRIYSFRTDGARPRLKAILEPPSQPLRPLFLFGPVPCLGGPVIRCVFVTVHGVGVGDQARRCDKPDFHAIVALDRVKFQPDAWRMRDRDRRTERVGASLELGKLELARALFRSGGFCDSRK